MKILVVDDEADSQLVMQALVRDLGHQCFVAANGDEAWGVLDRIAPQLVITDWKMPGLDGLELCRKIRDREDGSYTYLIVLTATGGDDHAVAALKAGADDYMTKPPNRAQLEQRLIVAERITSLFKRTAAAEAKRGEPADGGAGGPADEPADDAVPTVRILIADDDATTRVLLAHVIGAEPSLQLVGEATSTEGAVAIAVRERPDVAILDWDMPGGGGGVAAEAIRKQAPTTRVIALSASKSPEASSEMLRAGARTFLVKGGSKAELLASIRDAVKN